MTNMFTNERIKNEIQGMKTMIKERVGSFLDSDRFFNKAAEAFFSYGKIKILLKKEIPGEWERKDVVECDDGNCFIVTDSVFANHPEIFKDTLIERGFKVSDDMGWFVVDVQ